MTKILAFAGSTRTDSFNRKLIRAAAAAVEAAGGTCTVLELKDYPMPLFDQDLEASQGAPESVKKLKALMKEHQGLLIASPEYNSSVTPLLKNVIDWTSRSEGPNDPGLSAYKGKVAGIISASPGALGGLRGLTQLRSILGNIGVVVIPEQFALGGASEAFTADGKIADEKKAKQLTGVVQRLVAVAGKLA